MSFWPFPKTLLAELSAGLERGPGVELGSGRGELQRRLAPVGISLLAADLRPPCDVRLDATRLPFRPGSLGVVVAGNLVRHLSRSSRRQLLDEIARVLRPGGRALFLEDDPVSRSRAEANYRTSLELLARVDPTRGPALDLPEELNGRPVELAELVWSDSLENEEQVRDPLAPIDWLAARGGVPTDELVAHRAEVMEHGMEYGRFHACVLQRAQQRTRD